MKPIVGITCQYNDIISKDRFDVKSSYADSLAAAGAVPVIILLLIIRRISQGILI